MGIYVYKDDQQLGPFENAQVAEALHTGKFSYDNVAWQEGWTDWRPLTNIVSPSAAQQNPDFHETRTWRRGARSLDREPFALALCNGMDVSNSFDTDANRANICSFYIP
jgi:hypothetical protein